MNNRDNKNDRPSQRAHQDGSKCMSFDDLTTDSRQQEVATGIIRLLVLGTVTIGALNDYALQQEINLFLFDREERVATAGFNHGENGNFALHYLRSAYDSNRLVVANVQALGPYLLRVRPIPLRGVTLVNAQTAATSLPEHNANNLINQSRQVGGCFTDVMRRIGYDTPFIPIARMNEVEDEAKRLNVRFFFKFTHAGLTRIVKTHNDNDREHVLIECTCHEEHGQFVLTHANYARRGKFYANSVASFTLELAGIRHQNPEHLRDDIYSTIVNHAKRVADEINLIRMRVTESAEDYAQRFKDAGAKVSADFHGSGEAFGIPTSFASFDADYPDYSSEQKDDTEQNAFLSSDQIDYALNQKLLGNPCFASFETIEEIMAAITDCDRRESTPPPSLVDEVVFEPILASKTPSPTIEPSVGTQLDTYDGVFSPLSSFHISDRIRDAFMMGGSSQDIFYNEPCHNDSQLTIPLLDTHLVRMENYADEFFGIGEAIKGGTAIAGMLKKKKKTPSIPPSLAKAKAQATTGFRVPKSAGSSIVPIGNKKSSANPSATGGVEEYNDLATGKLVDVGPMSTIVFLDGATLLKNAQTGLITVRPRGRLTLKPTKSRVFGMKTLRAEIDVLVDTGGKRSVWPCLPEDFVPNDVIKYHGHMERPVMRTSDGCLYSATQAVLAADILGCPVKTLPSGVNCILDTGSQVSVHPGPATHSCTPLNLNGVVCDTAVKDGEWFVVMPGIQHAVMAGTLKVRDCSGREHTYNNRSVKVSIQEPLNRECCEPESYQCMAEVYEHNPYIHSLSPSGRLNGVSVSVGSPVTYGFDVPWDADYVRAGRKLSVVSRPDGLYLQGTGSRSLSTDTGINFVGLSNSEYSIVSTYFDHNPHVRDSPEVCDIELAQNYNYQGTIVDFLSIDMPAIGKKVRMESTVTTGGRSGLLNGKAQDVATSAIANSMNRAVASEAGFANFISNIVNPLDNVSVTPPLGQTLSANVRSQVTIEFSALFDSAVSTSNRYLGYLSIGQLQAMCAILGTQPNSLFVICSYTSNSGGLCLTDYWSKSITPTDGILAAYAVGVNPTNIPLALSSAYDVSGSNLKLLCTLRNGNTLVGTYTSPSSGSILKTAGSYNVCMPAIGAAAGGDFIRVDGCIYANAAATRVLTIQIVMGTVDKAGTLTETVTTLNTFTFAGATAVIPILGFLNLPNLAVGIATLTLRLSANAASIDVCINNLTITLGCAAAAWNPATPFGNWQLVASPNRPTVASSSTSASAYAPWAGATLGSNATSQYSIAGSILVAQFGPNVDLGDFIGMEPKTLGSVPGVQSVPASQGFYSVDNYLPQFIAGTKFGIDEQPNFAMPCTLMLAELPAPGSAGGNYYYRFASAQFHLVPTINQGLKPETASLDMDWVEAAQEALQPPILCENPNHPYIISDRVRNAVYRLINNRGGAKEKKMLQFLSKADQREANKRGADRIKSQTRRTPIPPIFTYDPMPAMHGTTWGGVAPPSARRSRSRAPVRARSASSGFSQFEEDDEE